ncbi:MAG TPA: GNAT family N-acetyltransferase [Rubricoccaceae bacterium]|nr:GNAT family N-acetyltransferase [Rubricoccaceae bacterium]
MTPAVRIEPLARRHAPAVQRLAADPRIAATTLLPDPYPPDGAAHYAADAEAARAEGTAYSFAVLAGDTLVGACGLKEVHDGQAELGYWIGVPFWGRGYATEAARLVAAFGFEALGLARITAHTLARNPSSARVLEKAGFRLVGREKNPFAKWAPDDVVLRYLLERPPPDARGS